MTWTRNGKPTKCDDDRATEALGGTGRAAGYGRRPSGGGTIQRARTGMRGLGNTKGEPYLAQINIRLTKDDLTALHDACLRLETSASAFARLAIRAQIARMEAGIK